MLMWHVAEATILSTTGIGGYGSPRTRGPITTNARRRQDRRFSYVPHEHSWLWVPDRAHGACHRAALRADPLVRLSGTTWMGGFADSNFQTFVIASQRVARTRAR